MTGESLIPSEYKLNQLRELFPEAFSEGEVDFEKLKATLGEHVNFTNERYVLNWAGKSDSFRELQTPITHTLIPVKEESLNFGTSKNVFIEGENLNVLKVLQRSYFSKIKMIYIDPPYNTGGDSFIYPDKFYESKDEYEKRVGYKDDSGNLIREDTLRKNRRENGHYHSSWLNMMYPRLFLAKSLLRLDGVIFVSIDDHEVHNLRLLMDEIFGQENFEGHLHWRRRHNQPNDKTKMIGIVAEHILCYAKNSRSLKESGVGKLPLTGNFSNPDNDPKGEWASKPWKVGSDQTGSRYTIITPTGVEHTEEWMGEESTYNNLLSENRIIFSKNGSGLPRKKYYKSEREREGQCANNWWSHDLFGHNQEGNDELTTIFGGRKNIFSNPKPTRLIKSLMQIANVKDGDYVLDFFGGSGSTADSILKYSKEGVFPHFIIVQLAERIEENQAKNQDIVRFLKELNLPFSIAELSKERIRRSIKLNNGNGFKIFRLSPSNFKQWRQVDDETTLKEQMELFVDPLEPDASVDDIVYELLLKNGKELTCPIEQKKGMYFIDDNDLVLILKSVDHEIIEYVLEIKPKKVIALDRLFSHNDPLKTNTILQMKHAEIEFVTL